MRKHTRRVIDLFDAQGLLSNAAFGFPTTPDNLSHINRQFPVDKFGRHVYIHSAINDGQTDRGLPLGWTGEFCGLKNRFFYVKADDLKKPIIPLQLPYLGSIYIYDEYG